MRFLYWFTQTWATSSLSRQPELERFTKYPPLHFQNMQNHTKDS